MPLNPGDLCIVIPTEHDSWMDRESNVIGCTVVLVCEDTAYRPNQAPYAPFWHCSGVPSHVHGISHLALRKIPPAPMLDEPIEEETEI